jgi:hypothetical protein
MSVFLYFRKAAILIFNKAGKPFEPARLLQSSAAAYAQLQWGFHCEPGRKGWRRRPLVIIV